MGIRRHTCFTLECDTPDDISICSPWEQFDGEPHWPSREEMLTDLVADGWTLIDNVARCPACSDTYREQQCEQTNSHRWTRRRTVLDAGDDAHFVKEACEHCGVERLVAYTS